VRTKGRVLFVDDEKRVLNSMRGMFRRDYDLYLTTEGARAVTMAAENDVDVIVADQRMPGMTGVEVLAKVRDVSPRTVRILLTGYADPNAIQGSINVGEVFRFLSKPCPPSLLRETLTVAVEAANASLPGPDLPDLGQQGQEDLPVMRDSVPRHFVPGKAPAPGLPAERTEPEPPASRAEDPPAQPPASASHESPTAGVPSAGPGRPGNIEATSRTRLLARSIGVVVFTSDNEFAELALRIIDPERPVIVASSLGEVTSVLEHKRAGVFLTDRTDDSSFLQRVIGALKEHLPEVVTIVVSESRDANDMIRLINYGQVYRYAVKPVNAVTLRTDVTAAVLKHLQLRNHPELIQRHRVVEESGLDLSPTINRFIASMARLRKLWTAGLGRPH